MPTGAAASFIDDVVFLDALDRCDPILRQTVVSRGDGRIDAAALDALENGLPMNPHAPRPTITDRTPGGAWPAYLAGDPVAYPDEPLVEVTRRPDRTIRLMMAAVVLMACVTAGSVTAAFVFHNRLVQISASRPASR